MVNSSQKALILRAALFDINCFLAVTNLTRVLALIFSMVIFVVNILLFSASQLQIYKYIFIFFLETSY